MLKLSDIAVRAGVSPTTVSFVLNERPEAQRIREKTRIKVLEAAEELGYRSNHLARAMRTGNTKMLGLLGGRASEEQVGQMLEGALDAADAQGYTLKLLRLHSIGNSAQQAIRRSSELRLMGMLALHLPEPILEDLHAEASSVGTPLVLMDARCANPDIPQVVSDDEGGVTAGVDHLVKLGHTRIAFIHGGGETTLGHSRIKAFERAIRCHGLTPPPNYFREGAFRFREPSVEAARALLALPPPERPTAIFCSGDLMALAALQVAHELRIQVPRELSIVGFANMSFTEFAQLTTVEQPFLEMGCIAVETLLNMIGERSEENGRSPNAEAPESSPEPPGRIKVLPTRLVERASTAPPL